jgi:hypothetical protein
MPNGDHHSRWWSWVPSTWSWVPAALGTLTAALGLFNKRQTESFDRISQLEKRFEEFEEAQAARDRVLTELVQSLVAKNLR